ncbi:hypothetical protein SNE40_012530 [Patella caerulea]|uniref:Uncharacterized protein n=1 Tax=Patella caerulea TaxID=87958 RepID=A0AAN8PNE4_PATCE
MSLKDSVLYKTIMTGDLATLIPVLRDYSESGQSFFLEDPDNGETLIHHIVNHGEKYCEPRTVSLIYLFAYAPFDLDKPNINGDTALHLAVRKKGAYRILIALIRCGADPEVKNNEGKTPEDILIKDRPSGWEEMLHWLNKFKPGLYRAVTAEKPDKKLIERLLRYWCRLTMVKNSKIINLKCIAHSKHHQLDLVYLLEKYENTIEFAMALLSGKVCVLKSWKGQDLWNTIDINTKDYSYQKYYKGYPEEPQPLLAAVWEINSIETIEYLMSLNPDTNVLFSGMPNCEPKPLFFHLMGAHAPDPAITKKILKGCDMNYRAYHGQTVLHEAILHDVTEDVFKHILNLGANVASRDRYGQTARNLAVSLNKLTYARLIDEHVLQAVRECNVSKIESLVLAAYDFIINISDKQGQTAGDISKKKSSKQLKDVIEKVSRTQEYIKKLHAVTDKGSIGVTKKLLAVCKRMAVALDKCGRNVLHHAVLHRHIELVLYISKEFPSTLNAKDNLGRSPFHYAYLFLPCDKIIKHMEANGADGMIQDYAGFIPSDYLKSGCHTTNQRIKEIVEFDLDVYIVETSLEKNFLTAIKNGDLRTVEKLTAGLKEFGGGFCRFSKMLFDCLDYGQWHIANYLITIGFNTEIWKQYEHCSPDDPLCAMMECNHGMTSFAQRVHQIKAIEVHALLEQRNKNKASVKPAGGRPGDGMLDGSVKVF